MKKKSNERSQAQQGKQNPPNTNIPPLVQGGDNPVNKQNPPSNSGGGGGQPPQDKDNIGNPDGPDNKWSYRMSNQ